MKEQSIPSHWVSEPVLLRNISSIDYSILSQKDIFKMSQVEVKTYELYDKEQKIVPHGPLDTHMGVGRKDVICSTCRRTIESCPGHFGHLNLSLPVIHIGFFKTLLNVLKCVCKTCGNVLINSSERIQYTKRMTRLKGNPTLRTNIMKKILKECNKHKKCFECQSVNPSAQKVPRMAGRIEFKYTVMGKQIAEKISRDYTEDRKSLIKAFDQMKSYIVNPIEILELLRRIPKKQYPMLNFGGADIEDLLVNTVIIPPVCIRPSVALQNSLSNQDDLTMIIREAVVLNSKIMSEIRGDDTSKLQKDWYLLQCTHTQLINSQTPNLPTKDLYKQSGAIRSLVSRLKGKQGRFRQNLSGKRSNFTGRTVISPDPNLHPTEVIIPVFMSKILTISVPVTARSISFLKECIANGSGKGGANFVVRSDGSRFAVGYSKNQLRLGDVVQRHIRDGDIVIFNRQPSLHRVSMMGFRAKIAEGNTLRFNECVCSPFNADFDGDEMNIHVPQTLEARSQALHLMGVSRNIMTPKNGQPIISLIQDFLTTAFLISDKDRFFTRKQLTQILSGISDANQLFEFPPPAIIKPTPLWTGKQVISCLLCPNKLARININLQVKEKTYTKNQFMCVRDGWVYIRNSELLMGQLGKTTLGGNKNGVIYALIRDNSHEAACQMMHRFAKLSSRWLTNFGMTIGIADVTPTQELSDINKRVIQQSYQKCLGEIRAYEIGTFVQKSGMTLEQSLQSALNMHLSGVRETVGTNCITHLDRYNKPLIMSLCGSKGNPVNLSQMIGCVGQQTVGGKRIAYGFIQRTLPHFIRNSTTPEARGFVKNSFFSGLTATEFFFHTMGGREGLIDTAVKTAQTGYMQRRLIKILQDIVVMYDMTVRTCDKRDIIQFRYGQDGLDAMRTEDSKNPINLSNLQLFAKSLAPRRYDQPYLTPAELRYTIGQQISNIQKGKLIPNIESVFAKHGPYKKLAEYFETQAHKQEEYLSKMQIQPREGHQDHNRYYLENCKYGITSRQLKTYMKYFVEKMNKAVMEPGEPVGAITAQSIGEPATQMTLKTFHFAGIASMSITQGVPRINQIINAKPNILTPIITIHMNHPSLEDTIKTKGQIQSLVLEQVLESIEEVYGLTSCHLVITLSEDALNENQYQLNMIEVKNILQKLPRTPIDKVEIINGKFHVFPQGKSNPIFELKVIRRKIVKAKIAGIETVKRVIISTEEKTNDYMMFAEGLGLKSVLCKYLVNSKKTFSNHIMEVEAVLGIEAARKSIINQVGQTMKEHGVNVDTRHLYLLAQVMSCKGKIIGFTRYGIDKMKDSTLMLASFQKTTDFLFDAASQAKHDRLRGVSQKIIMGKPITLGTGMFEVCQQVRSRNLFSNRKLKSK